MHCVCILVYVHTDAVHTNLDFDRVSVITKHLKHKFDLHMQAMLLKRTRSGHKASESDAKLLPLVSNVLSADHHLGTAHNSSNTSNFATSSDNSSNQKMYWQQPLIYTGKLGTSWYNIIHVSAHLSIRRQYSTAST
jgi:hypothetical protein